MSKRVHFFNTFFFKKLSEKENGSKAAAAADAAAAAASAGESKDRFLHKDRASHDRVKKWTKHVDIFSKVRR